MYRIYAIVTDFANEVNKNNVSALASSAAFFIFLSLIPIVMLLGGIVPYTMITEADLMRILSSILPDTVSSLAVGIVEDVYDKSPAALSAAAVITVWSAAKGLLAIMRGLNAISRVDETRNYILLRLRASVYTVIMLVIIVFFLFIMVFGNLIVKNFIEKLPNVFNIWEFMMHFRFLYAWIILAFLFALLYTWLPNKRLKFSLQIPGAVVTSIAWSLFSWGFSIYVEHFNTFGIYGSLTTIIIVMLWLYICMYIFMAGAEMNYYFRPVVKKYYEKRGKRKEDRKRK